jgi:hypothetical protein
MDTFEKIVFDDIGAGRRLKREDLSAANELVKKGWLVRPGAGSYTIAPPPAIDPDWIWLPNELVTGAANEKPPVELVRQTQDVMTLRLLIDFYHAQNLRDDGGISRRLIWQSFEKRKVGQQAQYVVWGFKSSPKEWAYLQEPLLCHRRDDLPEGQRAADLFSRVDRLKKLGLIEWIPHLLESDLPDAEIIHPFGMGNTATTEDALGSAGHAAGLAMVTPGQYEWAKRELGTAGVWLAPVPEHITNVEMIGVARLRYRPHTSLTAAWWAELQQKGQLFRREYLDLARRCKEKAAG